MSALRTLDAGIPSSLAPAEVGAPTPPRRRRWGRARPLPGPICHLIARRQQHTASRAELVALGAPYTSPPSDRPEGGDLR